MVVPLAMVLLVREVTLILLLAKKFVQLDLTVCVPVVGH